MIPLPDRKLVVIDIETTDTNLVLQSKETVEPIEIGAVKVDSEWSTIEEFSVLIRPDELRDFSPFCQSLTELSRSDLEDAESFKEVWRDFAEFTNFNGCRLASWGSTFDYHVLQQAYRRAGLGYPHAYPFLDLLSMVYHKAGEWGFKIPGYSLKSACDRFGIEPEVEHRALSGARKAVEVMRAVSRLGDAEDILELM